jgi:hypothetical protein
MKYLRQESNEQCQSILVTHYVDSQSLLQQEDFLLFGDDENAFDALHAETKEHRSGIDSEKPYGTWSDESSSGACLPWPTDHASFLNESDTQKLLCLEIASGSASNHRSAWINEKGQYQSSVDATSNPLPLSSSSSLQNPLQCPQSRGTITTKGPVLFPGSLRERGEFCIVYLSLTEPAATNSLLPRFSWQEENVYFFNIHD